MTGNEHKVSAITSKNLLHIQGKSNIFHQTNPSLTLITQYRDETWSTYISFHLGLFSF